MEKKRNPLQIYAILICVISVITVLITLTNLVFSVIDKSEPLYAGRSQIELSSFENFKMDVMKDVEKDQEYIPDDATIKQMYESAKEDKVKRVIHQANRNIVVNSVVGILALLLFLVHWFLLKKDR